VEASDREYQAGIQTMAQPLWPTIRPVAPKDFIPAFKIRTSRPIAAPKLITTHRSAVRARRAMLSAAISNTAALTLFTHCT